MSPRPRPDHVRAAALALAGRGVLTASLLATQEHLSLVQARHVVSRLAEEGLIVAHGDGPASSCGRYRLAAAGHDVCDFEERN